MVVGYTARDGLDTPASSTLTVTINGSNDNPNAVADTGSASENQTGGVRRGRQRYRRRRGDTAVPDRDRHGHRDQPNVGVNGIDAASAFSMVGGQIQFAPGTLFDRLDHDDTATVIVAYTITDSQAPPARRR